MHHSLTILGSGYTAQFLFPLAEHRYAQVFASSRDPDRHLTHVRTDRRIRFDLERSDTWENVPSESDVLWCFPAVPIELVQPFADATSLRTRRLVVLGSTSAYDRGSSPEYPPGWVDETAPLDLKKPRVLGEELLRTSYNAIILRVSGIYGPGRNPVDWIRSRRVNRSPKYVNLIHVEDLATTCLAALHQGDKGAAYNVSDGTPRTWEEMCEAVERRWGVHSSASPEPTQTGKRVSNKRMCELLKLDRVRLRHGNLYEALELIQNSLNEEGPLW